MLGLHVRRMAFPGPSGPRVVIEDLRFELASNEIVALVGPSGCGKTTLLRIIGGLELGYQGRLAWEGGRVRRIATVFQEPRLLPWRTVRENIDLVSPPDPGRGAALLTDLGLAPAKDLYPSALSLGMARRVALARALAFDPELLLLDEPFVSLDAASAEMSRQILLSFWATRPCTVVMVTHDLAEAASVSDRILLLSAERCQLMRIVMVPAAHRRRGIAEGSRIAAEIT